MRRYEICEAFIVPMQGKHRRQLKGRRRPVGPAVPRWRGHRTAFTLIELLVVIAIIALLVSILLPALKNAKEIAKTGVCLTTIRTLGVANQGYSNEYNEYVVPGQFRSYPNNADWVGLLTYTRHVEAPTTDDPDRIVDGSSPFRCPSGIMDIGPAWGGPDFPPPEDPQAPQNNMAAVGFWEGEDPDDDFYVHSWYAINEETWKVENTPFGYVVNGDEHLWKITELRRASDLVGLFDGLFAYAGYFQRIGARHGADADRTNVLFLDGHTETLNRAGLPFHGHDLFRSSLDAWAEEYPSPYWRVGQAGVDETHKQDR